MFRYCEMAHQTEFGLEMFHQTFSSKSNTHTHTHLYHFTWTQVRFKQINRDDKLSAGQVEV